MHALVQNAFHVYDALGGEIGARAVPEGEDSDESDGDIEEQLSAREGNHGHDGADINQNLPGYIPPYGVPKTGEDFRFSPPRQPVENAVDEDVAAMETALDRDQEYLEECARIPLYAGAKLS